MAIAPLLACRLLCLVAVATAELVHVSVLFRHGHRSPVQLLPGLNYTVANTWKDGLGQLTNIGKQNEFELGQFLRKRYGDFAGSRYNSSDHYARSTNIDRTLMSAQTCLAGLFPPVGEQQWNSGLLWQPIPVHTLSAAEDWLLGSPEFPCPERDSQFARTRSDPARLALYEPFADFMRRLSSGAGVTVTADSVHSVLDTLWIDRVAGLPDPAWLEPGDWDRLVAVGSLQWREYSWTADLIRFGSGVLLDEILTTVTQLATQGGPKPSRGARMRLYSDHDTTVASTLAALGNREFVWPNFASCVMFELHRDDQQQQQYSLQVLFRNDTTRQPYSISLPDCPSPCPLTSAVKVLGPMRLTPQQLLARCQTGGGGGGGGGGFDGFVAHWGVLRIALAGLLLLACLCLLGIVACRFVCRRKRRTDVVYRTLSDLES